MRPILDISDACTVYDKIINHKIPKGIYNVYSYNITVDQIAEKIKHFLYTKGLFVKIVKNNKIKENKNTIKYFTVKSLMVQNIFQIMQ